MDKDRGGKDREGGEFVRREGEKEGREKERKIWLLPQPPLVGVKLACGWKNWTIINKVNMYIKISSHLGPER